MTAPATETAPRPPARRGNALTRKAGPLPVWAWGVVVLAGVGAVIILRRRRAAATTTTTTSGTGAPVETAIPVPENAGISQSQYSTLLSQDAALYEQILDLQGEDSRPRRRPDRDREEDRESRNKEEEENDRCPDGYHFLAVPAGSDIFPLGARRVKGGFCVPDKKPRRRGVTLPEGP